MDYQTCNNLKGAAERASCYAAYQNVLYRVFTAEIFAYLSFHPQPIFQNKKKIYRQFPDIRRGKTLSCLFDKHFSLLDKICQEILFDAKFDIQNDV